MSYVCFIILNAVQILRPSELFEAIYGWPLFNVTILVCLAVTMPQILAEFSPKSLANRPITVCVVGIFFSIVVAGVTSGNLDMVSTSLDEFSKIVIYYFLLMAVVTNVKRLRGLLFWVTIFLAILALLTLLNLNEVIHVQALTAMPEHDTSKETGIRTTIIRLQASGIFNNPNAYARVLTVGMLLSIYWITDPKMRLLAPFWLGVLGLFGTAQLETKSRGGFLGLVFGLVMLFLAKFGVKRGLPLVLIGAPAMLLMVGGRQADMTAADEGTGAHRIGLWRLGMEALFDSKFLGIGHGMYPTVGHGYQAHNSFVHGYVELGFIGGTFFFGCFYFILTTLWNLHKNEELIEDSQLRRMRPFLLAVIGGEVVGFMSISRNYVTSTYLLVGMGAAYMDLLRQYPGIKVPRVNQKVVTQLFKASVIFYLILYVYVRYKTRFD